MRGSCRQAPDKFTGRAGDVGQRADEVMRDIRAHAHGEDAHAVLGVGRASQSQSFLRLHDLTVCKQDKVQARRARPLHARRHAAQRERASSCRGRTQRTTFSSDAYPPTPSLPPTDTIAPHLCLSQTCSASAKAARRAGSSSVPPKLASKWLI